MSHTEGNLSIDRFGNIKTPDSDDFRMSGATLTRKPEAEANTRRLVACWNALEGVPTEWLENYVAGGAKNILQENAELKDERDAHRDNAQKLVELNRRIIDENAVIKAELLTALRNLLFYAERNTCSHEETHRGGAIWEICDSCGAKWADDEGGKPAFVEPEELKAAAAILAKYSEVNS